MKTYVLGFAFEPNRNEVLLIEKTKPEWQAGFLNGIGGKVEDEESYTHAMTREFKEETGISTNEDEWSLVGYLTIGNSSSIAIFAINLPENKFFSFSSPTEELVGSYSVQSISQLKTIDNIPALVHVSQLHLNSVYLFKLAITNEY